MICKKNVRLSIPIAVLLVSMYASRLSAQLPTVLPSCGVSYIDPQEGGGGTNPSQDTLLYNQYFSDGQQTRAFFVDINAFGGSQIDRAWVYAILPDSSLKELGTIAFGNCVTCLDGFALVHEGQTLVQDVNTVAEMNMWIQSLSQPAFALTGNLQTLSGVGRISGRIPFCAIGWRVVYAVYSDPNSVSTEFSTHILCPQALAACPIVKNIFVDCQLDSILMEASLPANCFAGNTTVQWSNAQGWVSAGPSAALPLESDNLGWYYFSVEDDCCRIVDSMLVELPPFAQAGPDQSACRDEQVSLVGTGGFGHFWELPGGALSQDSLTILPGVQPTQAGTYILHAFNAQGCEDTDTLVLEVQVPPSPQIGLQEPCLGETLTLQVLNDTAYSTIEWLNPQGAVSPGGVVANFQNSDAGLYTVNATDALGCMATAEVLVNGHAPPELSIEIQESCDSTRVFIMPENYSYVWSNGLNGSRLASANGGIFMVTVTDPMGCAAVQTIELPEPEGPEVQIVTTDPFCPGDYGTIEFLPLNPDLPMIFSVDSGANYAISTLFEDLSPGTYNLVIQDDLGCLQYLSAEIKHADTVGVELGIDSMEVRPNTPIALSAQPIGSVQAYQWLPKEIDTGLSATQFLAQQSIDVRIIVEDSRGCRAIDGFHLAVVLGDTYAPNAFSPNSDGINDRFTLYSDNGSGEVIERLQVFDRWGSTVFEAQELPLNDESRGWDGLIDGKKAPEGIFAYYAIIRFGNGVLRRMKGDVNLVR